MEGGVVSRHAQRLIAQFMAACCGKSRREDTGEELTQRGNHECPPNEVALEKLHDILDALGKKEGEEEEKQRRSGQTQSALTRTKRNPSPWCVSAANQRNASIDLAKRPGAKRIRLQKKGAARPDMEQSRAYVKLTATEEAGWWRKVRGSDKPPTREQEKFLESVIRRCKEEQRELSRWMSPEGGQKPEELSEPARLCLLGIPGAGKSCLLYTSPSPRDS